jgi:hypothetical protein
MNIAKPSKAKEIRNEYRAYIEEVRKRKSFMKTTEFILETLKEMGYTEDNFKERKEELESVIESLNNK